MAYEVVIASIAEDDIDSIVRYLIRKKKNKAAAVKFLNDVENAVKVLECSAESFQFCVNRRLHDSGYRKLYLKKSKYFVLYRIEEYIVYIDDIFHQLQDFENKID